MINPHLLFKPRVQVSFNQKIYNVAFEELPARCVYLGLVAKETAPLKEGSLGDVLGLACMILIDFPAWDAKTNEHVFPL